MLRGEGAPVLHQGTGSSHQAGRPESIEADALLEQYGIDSVMVTQLTSELENVVWPAVTDTVVRASEPSGCCTGYFLESIEISWQRCSDLTSAWRPLPGLDPACRPWSIRRTGVAASAHSLHPNGRTQPSGRWGRWMLPSSACRGVTRRRAISMSSGPNLREGRDSITEVPKERWDHSLGYFDRDKDASREARPAASGAVSSTAWMSLIHRSSTSHHGRRRSILIRKSDSSCNAPTGRLGGCGLCPGSALAATLPPDWGRNVGVYVGVMYEEYQLFGAQQQACGRPVALPGSPASIANRVSYLLQLPWAERRRGHHVLFLADGAPFRLSGTCNGRMRAGARRRASIYPFIRTNYLLVGRRGDLFRARGGVRALANGWQRLCAQRRCWRCRA